MKLPDFLTQTADGEICLTNHRIGLQHVVHYYNEGFSPEMLVGQYPSLPLSLVHKVSAFYLENRAEVDVYIADCCEQLHQQRSPGKLLDIARLRERLETIRATDLPSRPSPSAYTL